MRVLAAIIALFLLLLGCSIQPATRPDVQPDLNTAAEKEKIKATLVDMWDAIEKGDIERYASYVDKDFTSFGETAKVLRKGKEAEVKAIKEWVEEPTVVHTEMRDPVVTIIGRVGWITYYWSDKGTSKNVPFATRGKSTRIFVNEDGKWLCIHGHYTLLDGSEQ